MSEVYGLLLSNSLTPNSGGFRISPDSNKASATYQIDFDALFQGRGHLFNKAQIRGQFITNSITYVDIATATGTVSIVGLANNDLGNHGAYICPLFPEYPKFGSPDASGIYFNVSTLDNVQGTVVSVPSGVRPIQVALRSVIGALLPNGDIPDYNLYLQFELYDRRE